MNNLLFKLKILNELWKIIPVGKIAEESLILPTDSQLGEKEIRRIAELIKKFFAQDGC